MVQRGKKTGPEKRRKRNAKKLLTDRIAANRRKVEVRVQTPEDVQRLAAARAEKGVREGSTTTRSWGARN
jgi:hypothetical protein